MSPTCLPPDGCAEGTTRDPTVQRPYTEAQEWRIRWLRSMLVDTTEVHETMRQTTLSARPVHSH